MTLWSQGGSSVMRGNMLVIPINNSILYVEPLYITSQNEASLPEVKRIIVSYGDKIVMEPSLEQAFEKLFGTPSNTETQEPLTDTPSDTTSDIPPIVDSSAKTLEQARAEFEKLQEAAATGDWEAFGKSMNELEKLLN